jgi:hypothetical protein
MERTAQNLTRRFVRWPGNETVIHVADRNLLPLCDQQNRTKAYALQSDIGPATCVRCLEIAKVIDEAFETE